MNYLFSPANRNLIIIILFCNAVVAQDNHTTFFTVDANHALTIKSCPQLSENCMEECTVWIPYFFFHTKIKVQTHYDNNSVQNLTKEQIWGAADAAVDTWNGIVPDDQSADPFEKDNFINTLDWWQNTSLVHIVFTDDQTYVGLVASATTFIAADITAGGLYTFQYNNPDWQTNDITSGDWIQTIVFLNKTATYLENFHWEWSASPSRQDGTDGLDVQHIMTHELGHVVSLHENTIAGSIMKSTQSNTSVRIIDQPVKNGFGALHNIETSAGLPLSNYYAKSRLKITGDN